MRQVGPNELLSRFRFVLGQLPASVAKDLASDERRRRDNGIDALARRLLDGIHRYEVLSEAPLEHGAGDDLFASARDRGASGVVAYDGG